MSSSTDGSVLSCPVGTVYRGRLPGACWNPPAAKVYRPRFVIVRKPDTSYLYYNGRVMTFSAQTRVI